MKGSMFLGKVHQYLSLKKLFIELLSRKTTVQKLFIDCSSSFSRGKRSLCNDRALFVVKVAERNDYVSLKNLFMKLFSRKTSVHRLFIELFTGKTFPLQ